MRDLDDFSEENRPLVTALRDPDAKMRLLALEHEVIAADDELAEELLRLLHEDPSEEVRARVPIALGPTLELCWDELDEDDQLPAPDDYNLNPLTQEGYDRLVETLRRVYLDGSNPELVRRRVLEGAVRSPQPWHKEATAAAFASEEELWRITAVFCMGHLPGFDDQIVEAFGSGSELVRHEAIIAAGRRGVQRLAGPLLALAGDFAADPDERVAAVTALPSLEDPRTLDLLDQLADGSGTELAEAAEEARDELTMMAMAEEALGDEFDEL